MDLIIKYFKEDLAQLALLNGNALPPPPLSLISSGWKITLAFWEYNFPAGFGGQRPSWLACTQNWGGVSENKDGAACSISHKVASWKFIISLHQNVHSPHRLRFTLCVSGKKREGGGDGRGDAFNFVRLLLSASVTATKAAEL